MTIGQLVLWGFFNIQGCRRADIYNPADELSVGMRVSYKLHTPGMDFPVTSVAFSPDERWLAAGSWNNTIKLWDVVTGRELRTIAWPQRFR